VGWKSREEELLLSLEILPLLVARNTCINVAVLGSNGGGGGGRVGGGGVAFCLVNSGKKMYQIERSYQQSFLASANDVRCLMKHRVS